jgi:hypothetical protein
MLSVYLTEILGGGSENDTLLYFFCDYRDDTKNSATAILRGILYQLLKRQPALHTHVSLRLDALERNADSRDALWLVFLDMVRDPASRPVTCVLDGLDECDKDSRPLDN